ncbi:NUDIX domain-containing protein [Lysinibacillus louembei]|uniref:NUDIX domain-containing protein n=1 Tax=Lysinibacillus louembei TaxID=1470088 RepID=A0ABZ0RX09_9BACI|nr:NUDIX domain-containing protein [Lysinibacillus louembei]WPK12690.1 NUDIX domain-containing protein [Lysinibacillus louembei]
MVIPTHIVAVGGIVENNEGDILLVKTKNNGWVFPGGQVEVEESLLDALVREIKEESGIDVSVEKLISVSSNTAIHKWHDGVTDVPTKVILDFICKPIGGILQTSEETTECKWVSKSKVLELVESPAIQRRYRVFLENFEEVTYMEFVTKPEFKLKQTRTI